jgi:hypothetical protein
MAICNRGHLQFTAAGMEGDPAHLRVEGARIECEIRPDPEDAQAGAATRRAAPMPSGISGILVLDTGAAMTAIDERILTGLEVPPLADRRVFTAMGSAIQSVYSCSLEFPGSDLPPVRNLYVVGAEFDDQGIAGVLGRDVLERGLFVYNGPAGGWTLAF